MEALVEEWRPVPGYKGLYEVSNHGFARSVAKKRVICFHLNRRGYLRVAFYKGGIRRRFFIHRLVLRTYAPKRGHNQLEGNHKDGNIKNNRLDNLNWLTPSDNAKHRHYELGKNNFKGSGYVPIDTDVSF